MKAIICGADGQDGFYIDALLKQQDYEVIPINKDEAGRISISDYTDVSELVKRTKSEFILPQIQQLRIMRGRRIMK